MHGIPLNYMLVKREGETSFLNLTAEGVVFPEVDDNGVVTNADNDVRFDDAPAPSNWRGYYKVLPNRTQGARRQSVAVSPGKVQLVDGKRFVSNFWLTWSVERGHGDSRTTWDVQMQCHGNAATVWAAVPVPDISFVPGLTSSARCRIAGFVLGCPNSKGDHLFWY